MGETSITSPNLPSPICNLYMLITLFASFIPMQPKYDLQFSFLRPWSKSGSLFLPFSFSYTPFQSDRSWGVLLLAQSFHSKTKRKSKAVTIPSTHIHTPPVRFLGGSILASRSHIFTTLDYQSRLKHSLFYGPIPNGPSIRLRHRRCCCTPDYLLRIIHCTTTRYANSCYLFRIIIAPKFVTDGVSSKFSFGQSTAMSISEVEGRIAL
jgi:hypothetical protein